MEKFLIQLTQPELKALIRETFNEVVSNELKNHFIVPAPECTSGTQELLTRREVAQLLQVSLPTLHAYTKQGLIKAIRFGRQVRYRKSDIEAAMQEVRSINYRK